MTENISPPSATQLGRVELKLESLESKVDLLADAVLGLDQRIPKDLDEKFERIDVRFDALEAAVGRNAEGIKSNAEGIHRIEAESRSMKGAILENGRSIVTLRKELERRASTQRVESLERRIYVLEDGRLP